MIAALPVLLAAATAGPPNPQGVWRGTLGKSPIVACFEDKGGSYYYESRRLDIPLWEEGAAFEEHLSGGNVTGTWRISSIAPDFAATWSSPDGKRQLPIQLKPVAKLSKDESCEDSPAYNGPRLESVKLGPPVLDSEQGLKLRREKARDAEVSRLQLDLPGPAGKRINSDLTRQFRELLGMAYTCNSSNSDFSSQSSVAFANARWIVVLEDTGVYCGGAHPDDFMRVLVYERASGRRVDSSDWLDLDDASWALLAKKAKLEPDCREVWDRSPSTFDGLRVWPSAKGLTFRPDFPHVVSACETNVEISLEQAAPFLTPAAKRELAPKR